MFLTTFANSWILMLGFFCLFPSTMRLWCSKGKFDSSFITKLVLDAAALAAASLFLFFLSFFSSRDRLEIMLLLSLLESFADAERISSSEKPWNEPSSSPFLSCFFNLDWRKSLKLLNIDLSLDFFDTPLTRLFPLLPLSDEVVLFG